MIERRSFLGGICGLAATSVFGTAQAAAARNYEIPEFRRGIGVSHAYGWADVEADGSYGSAPFSAPRFRFDRTQHQAIRAAGFDFVRLAVDVGPFVAFDGVRRDALDTALIDTVR